MNTYIALLRGINVGGKHRLLMAELRAIFMDNKLQDVHTYIQSGNVVFRAKNIDPVALSTTIQTAIHAAHGFMPNVFILTIEAFQHAVKCNPYNDDNIDPKTVQLYFLSAEPHTDNIQSATTLCAASENCSSIGTMFYLHAPNGIARSKLAIRIETVLAVQATARNARSASKI